MKELFLIFFLCCLTATSYGQYLNGSGIKIGFGLTNQSWKYDDPNIKLGWENSSGILAKAFRDFNLLSFLSLEGEVGYAQKGIKDKIAITSPSHPEGTGEFMNINNRLNYLSASLMSKLKYNLKLFAPYLIVGPEYNYLLSKKIEPGFEVIYDGFKRNAVGFTIGFGSEINLLPINILIEYQYSRDLTNNYESSNIEIKNYSHSFLIGIKL